MVPNSVIGSYRWKAPTVNSRFCTSMVNVPVPRAVVGGGGHGRGRELRCSVGVFDVEFEQPMRWMRLHPPSNGLRVALVKGCELLIVVHAVLRAHLQIALAESFPQFFGWLPVGDASDPVLRRPRRKYEGRIRVCRVELIHACHLREKACEVWAVPRPVHLRPDLWNAGRRVRHARKHPGGWWFDT